MDWDRGCLNDTAFQLRAGEDSLSLVIAEQLTPRQAAQTMGTCYGVAELSVGAIQRLGLLVCPEGCDPGRAEILNLPSPEEREEAAAEIAFGLMDIVLRVEVWRDPIKTETPLSPNQASLRRNN